MSRVLLIDCSLSGVAGDMFLASLIDLSGVNLNELAKVLRSAAFSIKTCKRFSVEFLDVTRSGIKAKQVVFKVSERGARSGSEFIKAVENASSILSKGREKAIEIARILVEAEAKVHGVSVKSLHLHECGGPETIAEIIGSLYILEEIDLMNKCQILTTPIVLGGGVTRISHGVIPIPSPAALEILRRKRFIIRGGPINRELTTPTGAAILAGLTDECFEFYPEMMVERIGYGAGSIDLKEVPNILRVVLGETREKLVSEEIYLLETDLDDVTGELVGHVFKKLFKEGALDVSVIPLTMKKSRPGISLRVMCNGVDVRRLAELLMKELGTLGVRVQRLTRFKALREVLEVEVSVKGVKKKFPVKVSKTIGGEIIQVKPEYEYVSKASIELGVSFRELSELVRKEAYKLVLK